MSDAELKVVDEVSFVHPFKGRLRLRHYNDLSWEILDANDIPVIQGKCDMTGEEYLLSIAKRKKT